MKHDNEQIPRVLMTIFTILMLTISMIPTSTANGVGVGNPDQECQAYGFDFGIAKWEYENGAYHLDGNEKSGYTTNVTGTFFEAYWTSNPAVAGIVVKGALDSDVFTGGTEGTVDNENLWTPNSKGNAGISHVTFCGNELEIEPQSIKPILECVEVKYLLPIAKADSEIDAQMIMPPMVYYRAHFGYRNENDFEVIIPIGNNNKFTGGGSSNEDRGQPTDFEPGRTNYYPNSEFYVDFDGTNLVWTLEGPDGSRRTSTASSNSKRCEVPEETEPVGGIKLHKYACPAGTEFSSDNVPDSEGEFSVPEGCEAIEGAVFGYYFKENEGTSWIGPEVTGEDFDYFGTTDSEGIIVVDELSLGQYDLAEFIDEGVKADDEDMLYFGCMYDYGGKIDNYEYTIVMDDETSICVAYNKMPEEEMTCEEAVSLGLLYGEITGVGQATVYNNHTQGFEVSLASYEMYSENVFDQTLYDYETKIVAGEGSEDFSVDVPYCTYQLDLICGTPVQMNPDYTEEEKLDSEIVLEGDYCQMEQQGEAYIEIKEGFPQGTHYVFECLIEGFTPDTYNWYFGDGEFNWGLETSDVYYVYDAEGDYTVTCVAIGEDQQAIAVLDIKVSEDLVCVEEPFQVVIVSDEQTMVGEEYSASVSVNPAWTADIPGATWIWATELVENPTEDETYNFTRTFDVNGVVSQATLDIATDNTYRVYLNGEFVGEDLNPNNFQLETQDQHDVTSHMVTGENVLVIEVTNIGVGGSTPQSNPAGLLYKLTVDAMTVCDEEVEAFTVWDIVQNSEVHTILETAVLAAELDGALDNPDATLTVFAPTDNAFNALPEGTIPALLADPEGLLTDILLYHVVGSVAMSTDLADGMTITTLNGEDVLVTINVTGVFINDAQVIIPDLVADNGVVHVIDVVLVPEAPEEPVEGSYCTPEDAPEWAIYHNGLFWAWASPCDGGCSNIEPIALEGWRYATESEWDEKPEVSAFGTEEDFKCAAHIFDPSHNHCDYSDAMTGSLTSQPTGSSWETWLVYDCGGEAPIEEPVEEEYNVNLYIKDGFPQGNNYVFVCENDFEAETFDWDFGNGKSLYDIENDNVWHTFISNGEYIVSCGATKDDVTVYDSLMVEVSGLPEAWIIMEHEGQALFSFSCENDFEADTFDWYFGDGGYMQEADKDVQYEFQEIGWKYASCYASNSEDSKSAYATTSVLIEELGSPIVEEEKEELLLFSQEEKDKGLWIFVGPPIEELAGSNERDESEGTFEVVEETEAQGIVDEDEQAEMSVSPLTGRAIQTAGFGGFLVFLMIMGLGVIGVQILRRAALSK